MQGVIEKQEFFTSARQEQLLAQLRQRYPFVYARTLTRTAFGRSVAALQLGGGPRKVLITAGHHANEAITSALLWRLLFAYCQALRTGGTLGGIPARTLFSGSMLYLVPLVNPDGADLAAGGCGPDTAEYRAAAQIAAGYPDVPFPLGWKANLRGVDLNLNYPARWNLARRIKKERGVDGPAPRDFAGFSPLDQPETAALAAFTSCIHPDLMLALHAQGEVIYPGPEESAPDGAAELGAAFAAASGYALEPVPPESANAGFKDWFLQRFRRPAFTIEVGSGENPLPPAQLDEIYARTLGIFTAALTW